MPKKVEAPEAIVQKIRLPTAGNVSSLMKQAINLEKQTAETSGELGELIKSYKNNKHVDPGAFRVVKAMVRLSDEKLAVRLAHLMHYIKVLNLEERASAQAQMFDERGEVDEDGEPDMRPRHLRQPGASGSDIDQAEIAAGGDSVVPLKH